jgi:hypothetical protein
MAGDVNKRGDEMEFRARSRYTWIERAFQPAIGFCFHDTHAALGDICQFRLSRRFTSTHQPNRKRRKKTICEIPLKKSLLVQLVRVNKSRQDIAVWKMKSRSKPLPSRAGCENVISTNLHR